MSTTVDERVVSLGFDNKQFESNVQTSLGTLERLKQGLNLTGASKGLEQVGQAAKNSGASMSVLGGAAETVAAKFSYMQMTIQHQINNLVDTAIRGGKRIASALTVDPIKTGFSEYETQINAVQTILANTESKGTTLKDVNKALDELNTYADKTIYNFTEMTRNIGTFTAAGVDLDKSVSSIQGIANLAAVSGSTSQQASTAMYQLSQALAAGKVSLMDWNSVVNAGMGGQVFQDALKRTSEVLGTGAEAAIKKYGSFRESLTQGEWLTTEVLTKTLEQFTMAAEEGSKEWENYKKSLMEEGYTEKQATEILKMANTATNAATKVKTFTQLWDTLKEAAQSGWTQSWEIIVGDFEEAKETLTKISDVVGEMINNSAKQRNELLQGWKDLGGRDDLLDIFENSFTAVMKVVSVFKEAMRDIFPPMTAEQLYNITKGIKEFTQHLIPSGATVHKLRDTFKGLFAILDIGKQLLGAVFKAIKPIFGVTDDLGGGVLSVTAAIGRWLVKLDETIKKTDIFGKAAEKIAGFIELIKKGLAYASNEIQKFLSSFAGAGNFPVLEKLGKLFDKVKEHLKGFGEALSSTESITGATMKSIGNAFMNSNFFGAMKALWEGAKTILGGLAKAFGQLLGPVIDKIGNGDFTGFIDFINALITGGIGVYVAKFVKGLGDIVDGVGDFKEGALDILEGAKDTFAAYQNQLNAEALKKIATAIAILVGSLVVLSFVDSEKLSSAVTAITILFADLMGGLALFNKFGGDSKGLVKSVGAMIAVSTAVLILAGALKMISGLSWEELGKGILGVAGLTAIVLGAAKILSQNGKRIKKGATQLVIFAAAIKILAGVCKDLATLSWEELGKGLAGVGGLMAAVAGFLRTAKLSGKAVLTATGVVILAAALKMLVPVCKDFATMKWEEIGKGLATIGALLTEVAIFTKLTGSAKHVISSGIALIAIAGAMKIFASAMSDFNGMSWEEVGKGFAAMAGALLAVTVALRFMPKNMIGMGTGLVIVGAAMVVLAEAMKRMSGMSWEEIGRGLAVLGGSMLILAIGVNAMKGAISGAAAMLVMAGALAILTPCLKALGDMSWESIGKSLLTLAGAFAVLGVAGLLLGPLVPAILGLAGSLALIGVSVLAVGAGLTLVGVGLSAIAVGLTAFGTGAAAGATALVAALSVIITGIASLIPTVAVMLAQGVIRFCQVIADGAPVIGEALKALVLSAVDVLVECVPVIADGLLKLVDGLLASLVEYTPSILSSLFQFVLALINGLADYIPDFIQAGFNLVGSIFTGIVDALKGIDITTLLASIGAVGLMAGVMHALATVAAVTPGAMAGVLGMAGVVAEIGALLAAFGALAQIPGLEWLINEGGELLGSIGAALGKLVGGLIGGIGEGITGSLPAMATDLSNFMTNLQPFLDGAKTIDSSLGESIKSLAGAMLALTGAELLDNLAGWLTGDSSLAAFGKELAEFGPYMKAYSDSVAGINPVTVMASAIAAQALSELAANLPNSGGLAGVFAGENDISTFGEKLVPFGESMVAYSNAVAGMNAEAVSASTTAAQALSELADNLPNSGGVASWFAGENDIDTFGDKLVPFGESMKAYSDAVAGINPEAVTASTTAAQALSELANNLPNSGGVASWFAGNNDISDFGDKLVPFGKGMKNYSEAVAGINKESIAASVSAANMLVRVINNMSSVDTSGVLSFSAAIETLGQTSIKSFVDAFDVSVAKLSQVGSNMIDSIVKGAESKRIALMKTVTDIVDKLITHISARKGKFYDAGIGITTKFLTGVEKNMNKLKIPFLKAINSSLTAIRVYYASFHSVGSYLVDGFAAGISANDYKAAAKARAMAKAAKEAAEDELDENSPSKEFYKIGDFAGLGFVNALDDYESRAFKSGAGMADSAKSGLNLAMSKVNDILSGEGVSEPTIRPVIDLSDIRAGAASISDMFSFGTPISVLANVGAINSRVAQRNQNGGNDDVVSAIEKLRKGLDNVGNTTYSIGGVTVTDSDVEEAIQVLVGAIIRDRRS